MSNRSIPAPFKKFLLSDRLWRVFPTPSTFYLNRERVRDPVALPELPLDEWALRERHALLARSEDRKQSLEGKGPGLATVNAVVVAAVLLAITSGWDKSNLLGRLLLVAAAIYAASSLAMPLYLVGPLRRGTIHVPDLQAARDSEKPEATLAERAAVAAMTNDLQNLRLANLLDAARRELTYAFLLLLTWALLVPIMELLER